MFYLRKRPPLYPSSKRDRPPDPLTIFEVKPQKRTKTKPSLHSLLSQGCSIHTNINKKTIFLTHFTSQIPPPPISVSLKIFALKPHKYPQNQHPAPQRCPSATKISILRKFNAPKPPFLSEPPPFCGIFLTNRCQAHKICPPPPPNKYNI